MKSKFPRRTTLAIQLAVIMASAAFGLVGCGGGSGGDGTTSSTPLSSTPVPSPAPAPATGTLNGTFVDAPTKGLQYASVPSGLTGTTDVNGTYQYQAGDTVTFTIPNGVDPIVVGSVKPVAPTGGSAITFVLSLTNGEAAAHVLQALNHSTSSAALDIDGVTLSPSGTAALRTYLLSNGSQLPLNVSIISMLTTAQAAATFPSGSAPTTPVASNFLTTVAAHLQSTMSGISTALTIPLSTLIPDRLSYSVSISNLPNAMPEYTIRYRNATGNTFVKTSQMVSPAAVNYYPSITYSASPTGNTLTETFHSYSNGGPTYPTYINTVTVRYVDPLTTLATYSVTPAALTPVLQTGSVATITLDKTFDQGSIAGKTITFTGLANDNCTSANPYVATVNASGTAFTASCSGTSAPTPNYISGFTIATVPNMPGLLAISLGGTLIRYWGLVGGTTVANGKLVSLTPGSTTAAGAAYMRAITAQ